MVCWSQVEMVEVMDKLRGQPEKKAAHWSKAEDDDDNETQGRDRAPSEAKLKLASKRDLSVLFVCSRRCCKPTSPIWRPC